MKILLLIDGNSILNRAYYGIRPLTNAAGLYTHAVYGMMNIILHHLEERKPDYAAVAFDRKAPTFRHQRYDGYKANRKGMPEELAVQLPYAKEVMAGLGLHVLETDGFEADDILGTCAFLGDEDTEVYVLTGDRDALQLIRDHVTVLLASTGETHVFDRAAFGAKYGIKPEQFVDVKALMGDSSDNIPGVPGIGEKTALKLIAEYGSLDGLYAHLNDGGIKGAALTKLNDGKDSAYLSQYLAAIDTEVPLGLSLKDLCYEGVCARQLKPLLTELELTTMIKRLGLDREEAAETMAEDEPSSYRKGSRTELSPATLCRKEIPYASVVLGEGELLLFDGTAGYRIPFADPDEIVPFLADASRTLVVEDLKKLCLLFGRPACKIFDVSLAAYVNDPSEGGYTLDRLAVRYLGQVLPDDADVPRVLYDLAYALNEKLKESEQSTLYYHIEEPLSAVLADMEREGFQIDREGLTAFNDELSQMCREYAEAIYFEAGHAFNLNSPKQLGEVLFDELKLPAAKKKTKTGHYVTDAETLEKLRPYYPIVDRILEYRQVAKLKSTYGDGLLKVADENGRIHSSFNQTVTATGRLSSSEPNLQNIPIRTELGRTMRRFFVPKNEEYLLVDADYSQIELRLLAAIAGDQRMIRAFAEGEDIHAVTASQVFGVPLAGVTPELRKRAKAVNFGIVYGISGFSLGEDLGVPKYEAEQYIKNYLAKYPQVSAYLNEVVEVAKRDGFVTTIFGRRRYIPELSSPKKMVQAFGKRVAMNSPIQGAAADIIKIAMIRVDEALRKSGMDAKLILQVHDELILEAHRSCAEEAAVLLKREMENAVSLAVPLSVEVGIGKNWYECK
ncbi:MAG: DNA polymerase I [Ruminococcaceae bacterium]|nr:DNA polymerase I [Oscillospiraceae bacterium]